MTFENVSRGWLAALLALVALFAIFVSLIGTPSRASDNPNNVPLIGEWEMITRVDSVETGGRQLSREAAIADGLENAVTALERTDRRTCFEPSQRPDEDFTVNLPGATAQECQAINPDGGGDRWSITLACQNNSGSELLLTLHRNSRRDAVITQIRAEATGRVAGEPPSTIVVNATETLTRIGDCS